MAIDATAFVHALTVRGLGPDEASAAARMFLELAVNGTPVFPRTISGQFGYGYWSITADVVNGALTLVALEPVKA